MLTVLPVTVLAVGGALLAAAPANAAASQCPAGKVCIFQDSNFGGEVWVADTVCRSDLSEDYPGNYPNVNDSASSIVNNTSKTIRLFENTGFAGRYVFVPANGSIADLKQRNLTVYHNDGSIFANPGEFNDVASSFC
ncbi:peptidase inhibitor family I36 protein [Streptomyces beigongshangae]|uniref:peptidase inhibitor family I36 protein n=1 Tax=Streptomyces beigongshangae TaxID=2841597 RepID=UPI001C84D43A|nr:peptidase inhibitor family I36 protein [Streptomyces sp. REN17]